MERDVLARDRFASLACPSCQSVLRVKADVDAAAPCPSCGHPLKYVAPVPDDITFIPSQRIEPDAPTSAPNPEPGSPSTLRKANDFLNTPTGIAVAWVIVATLLTVCVFLFIHWDGERKARENHNRGIESQRPPASRSTVPLLPGEPAPADPE